MTYKSKIPQLMKPATTVLAKEESKSFGNADDNLPSGRWLEHLSIERSPHRSDPRREVMVGEVLKDRDDDIYRTALTVN